MPETSPFGRALAAAGVIHVGLFMFAARGFARHSQPPATVPAMTLVAIEPISDAPLEPPRSEPHTDDMSEPVTSNRARVAAATTRGRRSPSAEPAASAMLAPGGEPTVREPWTLRVTAEPGGAGSERNGLSTLALDGRNRFMGERETPEDERRDQDERANRAAGEAMRGALHDNDVALGLGGGGPVVAALESALRESTAPDESHAVFVAVADESGNVLRIDVESASDVAAFHAVAAELLVRLQGHKVRVPQGARGLAMRIDVASALAMPSGGSVGIDPKSAGGHFDIADLGAARRRVIHARVLAEQLL